LWALRHAATHNLRRIIIAIPYTSIITQTAQVLRGIFGESNVLEHHSAFDAEAIAEQYSEVDVDEISRRQRLASENWDYPIIVTTNVQLFQSMMASKPSKCRKLHNIVKSVIILDEAQMLPREHLQPIIDSLDTYQRLFSCSILLTTASQPVFSDNTLKAIPNCRLKGLDKVTEIIPPEMKLYDRLRRVEICIDENESSYDDIAERMMKYDRVLCIVSTRKVAMEIFSRLPQEEGNYHLSRMMCSSHLSDTLKQIKTALIRPGSTVRVVSTQLIEAGVDVDFPVVMRQEAGLDSILQAAGRCNREGHERLGKTYVFKFPQPLPRGFLSNANSARLAMSGGEWDLQSPEAMTEYFLQLYSRSSTFDKAKIKELLYDIRDLNFESASTEFRLIEENGISVIVNYKNSAELIEKARHAPLTYKERKELSQYAVNLHEFDFKELAKAGFIEEVIKGIYFISERAQYNPLTGLSLENHWLDEILTI
jgi:CRISPR-associated endonuclease/helicase Cas3